MSSVTITVGIILYKNDEKEIERCLSGLNSQSETASIGEVLIRDQGGGECRQSVERWVKNNASAFTVRFSEGPNIGFGGGHNALFDQASEESMGYLCLNPDGMMHPNCFEAMIGRAEGAQWRGIFEAIQEPIMHPKKFDPKTGVTAWCSGACLLIPSAIYRQINGFDDDFFLYCEDVDISWRVKAAGYQCFTCADALFFHYAMDRTAREVEIWKSACVLAHKWRSAKFKTHALNLLASLVDIERKELQREVEKFAQRSIEDIYRANPDFRNNLTFAEPMWTF
nr:glycosyltransferase family 2 protein [Paraburkholderia sp. BL8N3]